MRSRSGLECDPCRGRPCRHLRTLPCHRLESVPLGKNGSPVFLGLRSGTASGWLANVKAWDESRQWHQSARRGWFAAWATAFSHRAGQRTILHGPTFGQESAFRTHGIGRLWHNCSACRTRENCAAHSTHKSYAPLQPRTIAKSATRRPIALTLPHQSAAKG